MGPISPVGRLVQLRRRQVRARWLLRPRRVTGEECRLGGVRALRERTRDILYRTRVSRLGESSLFPNLSSRHLSLLISLPLVSLASPVHTSSSPSLLPFPFPPASYRFAPAASPQPPPCPVPKKHPPLGSLSTLSPPPAYHSLHPPPETPRPSGAMP